MTDILTPAKKLVQQTIGGNNNTWGTILNNTLGLIDSALGGTLAKSISGNATLTSTEAHNTGFQFTGTLSGTAAITFPSFYGMAAIRNATSGGFSITCGISGATATVLNGETVAIWSDGTDFIRLSQIGGGVGFTGTGQVVLSSSPTIDEPTLAGSSITIDSPTATLAQDLAITRAYGPAPAGLSEGLTYEVSFSGDTGGSTDMRGMVCNLTVQGTHDITQAFASQTTMEIQGTSGTLATAYTHLDYLRLGLAHPSVITGMVLPNAGVYSAHVANEGDEDITSAAVYTAGSVDLADGTGLVVNMYGFLAGDMGHATRVTQRAAAFAANDMTGGAPTTAAYYSDMAAGTNKWFLFGNGNAASAINGNVRIGSVIAPTVALDVTGHIKGNGSLTIGTNASRQTVVSGAGNGEIVTTSGNNALVDLLTLNNNAITAASQGAGINFGIARSGTPSSGSGGRFYSLAEDDYTTGPKSKASFVFDVYSNGLSTGLTLRSDRTGLFSADLKVNNGGGVTTNATSGFMMLSACGGTPTGSPTNAGAGSIPVVYDTTANKLWAYIGSGVWKGVALT